MKAVLFKKQDIFIDNIDKPKLQPYEVLIKSKANGICSSDIYKWEMLRQSGLKTNPPELWGHECSGIVEEIGTNVSGFLPGDRITMICGRFAEYITADYRHIIKIPDNVDLLNALGEPVACCMHAMMRSQINLGDRVAIIGCGFMGLICQQLAFLKGASHITSFDIIDWRLDKAKELGADEIKLIDNLDNQYREELDWDSYDVVIEAAGTQSAVDLSTSLVKQHGEINLVGHHLSSSGMRTVKMEKLNFKAVNLINGHVRKDDEKIEAMRRGMELISSGRLNTEDINTLYPYKNAKEAFADLTNKKRGLFKATLIF